MGSSRLSRDPDRQEQLNAKAPNFRGFFCFMQLHINFSHKKIYNRHYTYFKIPTSCKFWSQKIPLLIRKGEIY